MENRKIIFKYVLKNKHTDKVHFKVYTLEQIEIGGLKALFDVENYEILERIRYTGLKDKNGNMIFEGDILSDGKGDDAAVFFTPPAFTATDKQGNVFWLAEGKVNKFQLEYTEITGNIHDNERNTL